MNTLKYTRHGITIVRRGDKPGAKYKTRIRFRGKCHEVTLCDNVDESFTAAVLARREIQAGRWDAFRQATALRSPETFAGLAEIRTGYLAFPGGDKGIQRRTKERNLQALDRFMAAAGVDRIGDLTAAKLAAWKWIKRELAAKQVDGESQTRILRSAQSELLQARSVFSPAALSYYRERCNLTLPPSLPGFLAEPGFENLRKDTYHAPADEVIGATFAAVAGQDRNLVVAFWLAVGFGLRASEMARAQRKDFQLVGGDVFFRPCWQTKSKRICEIGVQLDAWSRLAPLLDALQPADYILTGTLTERSTAVFRRISTLFQALGWQTTHHIHEMRAWAGCQIAMAHPQGLLAAQAFLRHGSYTTTQQYYGHHIKVRLDKVALQIPEIQRPAPVYLAPAVPETNRMSFGAST